MKRFFATALTALFIAPGLGLAQPKSEVDTVLPLINQGRHDKEKVTADRIRVAHSKTWPAATLVGFTTGSRGILLGAVVLDGKVYTANQAAPKMLAGSGWEAASPEERRRLAVTWLDECSLAFGESLLRNPKPGPDDAAKLRPLVVQALADGSVRVLGWVQEDPGRNGGLFYRRIFYVFGPHGDVVRARVLDRFYVGV